MEKIYSSFACVCEKIVNKYCSQFRNYKEDLLQEAYIAMLNCFLKYNPDNETGASFKTYFSTYVMKEVLNKCYFLNNTTKVSKNIIIQAGKWKNRIEIMSNHMSCREAIQKIVLSFCVTELEKYLCEIYFDFYDVGIAMSYGEIASIIGKSKSYFAVRIISVKKRILDDKVVREELHELLMS